MAPRETENNAYAKFWGDKQRTLWYVMVFLEWSIPMRARRTCPKEIIVKEFSSKYRVQLEVLRNYV